MPALQHQTVFPDGLQMGPPEMCIRDRGKTAPTILTLEKLCVGFELTPNDLLIPSEAVSYTHLDVYKRQVYTPPIKRMNRSAPAIKSRIRSLDARSAYV